MSKATSTLSCTLNTPHAFQGFEQLVFEDLRQIRHSLDHIGHDTADLFQTSVLRSALHIACDWSWIFSALWTAMQWGWWAVP